MCPILTPLAAPTIPHDVPLRTLADRYHANTWPLVAHQHAVGDPLVPDEVAGHALAALATSHALANRGLAGRWCSVTDALHAGATPAEVGRAMDLDADLVVIGLAVGSPSNTGLGS